jgi:hypothetical protein
MTDQLPQDTPITRARLADLPTKDIEDFVEGLQTRRLRSQTIYEEAKAAKAAAQEEKDGALLAKKLEQFEKKAETVDNGLKALDKLAKEILGIRLALGHEL